MATGEDVSLATRWVLERMERDQDERREWHSEAMAQTQKANASHDRGITRLIIAAAVRPLIELAILIVLIVKL